MKTKTIEQEIYDYICMHEATSFIELEQLFSELGHDYRGGRDICSQSRPGVVYWSNWSEMAAQAIIKLMHRPNVEMRATAPITYMIDGGMLTMPLVKPNRTYETPHWLPMVFTVKESA